MDAGIIQAGPVLALGELGSCLGLHNLQGGIFLKWREKFEYIIKGSVLDDRGGIMFDK